MKKIILAFAALAALAACTKETIIDVAREEIAFGNAFVNNATKAATAADPSYSTTGNGVALTQFNVYGAVNGVNIFAGNTVTKGDAAYGSAWTLTGAKQYWIAGADYKFVGLVDGNKDGVTETECDDAGLPKTITYTADGATDLLCDVVTVAGAAAPYSVVAFNYTHLLSKINFAVKNTTDASATNYRFVLTSAKITNAYKSAVYNVNGDTWAPEATMREFILDNLTINSSSTQYHPQEILLIPGSAVGVYIEANIEATDDDPTSAAAEWTVVSTVEKTFTNALGSVDGTPKTLAKATAYNFIVELGVGTEIQFTATAMPEWVDGDGDSNTVLQ